MAWVTVSSDSFNRSGDLGGSTLNNAAGGSEGSNTWTEKVGSWTADGVMAECDADALMYVGSTASVADQRVTYTIPTYIAPNQTGVVSRWTTGTGIGNGYLSYAAGGPAAFAMHRFTNGSFTQLGSNTGTPAFEDELSIQSAGTAISLLVNTSVIIGPVTDSTHASGKPALFGINRRFEDFLYEKDVAGGAGFPFRHRHPMSHMLIR